VVAEEALVADQSGCTCVGVVSATVAPEADIRERFPIQRRQLLDWTSPVTSRLLLEAGGANHYGRSIRLPALDTSPQMITVNEQSRGLRYRSADNFRNGPNNGIHLRFSASYITGSHAYKVGLTHSHGYEGRETSDGGQPLTYRFNNGVPNQITQRALPIYTRNNVDHNMAIYAQDRWTFRRVTASSGLRYDYFATSFPEQRLGPTFFTPGRDITFPAQKNLAWHDLSPRLGVSYDAFGTGKTALKVSLNKYLQNEAAGSPLAIGPNPLETVANNTTRSWNDANQNFVPDCDLHSPAANGECGASANRAFGTPRPVATYDPDLLRGWGKRTANWELSAGVQHELMTGTSLDVAYFRRAYQNFVVTDNRAISASDFDRFSIVVPRDERLPGGGGYEVDGLYNVKPEKFSVPADDYITFARNYGNQIQRWDGFDVTFNARPRPGMSLQGGTSTGRTSLNNCDIVDDMPELLVRTNLPESSCDSRSAFLTDFKLLGSYLVPRLDVQVAATVQSAPGQEIAANYVANNTVVAPGLGRPLSGGQSNMTVNIVEPGTLYGDRSTQVGLRIAKILRFGGTRATASLDIYNLFNSNTVLTQNAAFATWLRPLSIPNPRWAKIVLQYDF